MMRRPQTLASVVGLSVLGLASAAALATGCFINTQGLCSTYYNDPSASCPDTIVTDVTINIGFSSPTGLSELQQTTCTIQVIPRYPDPCCDPCATGSQVAQPVGHSVAVGAACP